MRILFASAELVPVVSVGGLGAAAAGLVDELRRQGVDVEVVLPDYGETRLDDERRRVLDLAPWVGPAAVRSGRHAEAGPLHLVSVPGMARPHPYTDADGKGWPDNDHRFFAFGLAIARLASDLDADILHVNDWHTASALAASDPEIPTILSIHNLAYQGTTDASWLDRLGTRSAAFGRNGECNPLAGAIALADAVVVVSPTYRDEILHREHGCGLDDLLASRGDALVGILNGIDTTSWDPATDPALVRRSAAASPAAKATNRAAVRSEVGLPEQPCPLIVAVTRLVDQKGIDLLLPSVEFLATMPAQLAILGAGEPWLVAALHDAAARLPDTVAFVDGYDDGLARRLIAGGDLLVMPSRFEPCGLTQMQAMRYGTLPIATDVGGLHDTIVDLDRSPDRGTGWLASDPSPMAILDALHRAIRGWSVATRRRAAQQRAMATDWSWQVPARRYRETYARLVGSPVDTVSP